MTADELVAALDARGERWELHRGVGSGSGPIWCVTLGQSIDVGRLDPAIRRFSAPTVVGVLAEALAAGPPLPVVPRPPVTLCRHLFEARKDGSKWALYYDGRSAGHGNQPSRRACEQTADRWCAVREAEVAAWEAKHGDTASGVEGVDFRWWPR